MKRHISIFTLLLCAFAAVGPFGAANAALNFYAASTHECGITKYDGTSIRFAAYNSKSHGYYYNKGGQDLGVTSLSLGDVSPYNRITAEDEKGLKFKGWWTKASGWEGDVADVNEVDKCVATTAAITGDEILTAGEWKELPLVVAKYVPVYVITDVVSPTEAGKVTGGGTVDEGGSVTLTATANTGWVFSKWQKDGADVDGGSTLTIDNITDDATYTAVFTKMTVNLTLDLKEGVSRIGYKTTSGASYAYVTEGTVLKAEYGSTYYLIAEAASGWGFNGESTKSQTLSNIRTAQAFAPVPTRLPNTVTLDRNGGTGGTDSVQATYGLDMPSIIVPTRTGYDFTGYFTTVAGGTQYYTKDGTSYQKWNRTESTTLYAHWNGYSYRIGYDFDGGREGYDAPSTAQVGKTFYVSAPTKVGYTFAGWKVTGDHTDYETARWGSSSDVPMKIESGETICFNGASGNVYFTDLTTTKDYEVMLKATWTANSYTVTFNGNGGSSSVDSMAVTYDSTYGDLATCTRTGYTFGGWWTAASGGTKVESTTKVALTANQTLYAHWTANSYTVTFEKNGGEEPSAASMSVTYGSTYGTLATCERTGYTFAGWYTAESGGTKVESTTKVAITAAQTLYAHWTAKTYTVTFDRNGGVTPSPNSMSVTYDSTYGTLATCERTGYTFAGWYTAASGGTKVESTTQVALTANQTLYAHWTANSYTVSFNANGGDGSMANQPFTYDVAQDLRANVFAKAGYGFAGWNTKSNGSGTSYANEQNVKNLASDPNATVTLYAQWQAGTYTVTFDANGGTTQTPSQNVTHGSTYGTLPTPTRKGYEFRGWWTAKEGGTEITGTTTVELTAAQTLFAHWEAKTYKVTINLKDGESYTDKLGKHSGPGRYALQEPLVFGKTNLNQIAVATKTNNKDYSIFLGYKVGDTTVYDGQGRNLKGPLGTYWTADYPTGTYCNDGDLELTTDWQNPNPHYTIDVAPSPAEAGTVMGAGVYEEGSNVVLMATVTDPGYSFAYWNRTNDNEVAYGNPLEFPASANAGYLAVFTGNVYTVRFFDDYDGDFSPSKKSVTYGQPFGELPVVTYGGLKEFSQWLDDDDQPVTADTTVAKAGNIYLHTDTPTTRNPVVTFIDPSNVNPTTKVEVVNGHVDAPTWNRYGYWFAGWDPAVPTMVTADLKVNAKWTSIADVLDCTNLVFNSTGSWGPYYEDLTALNANCMRLDSSAGMGDPALSTVITNDGTMTFRWKAGAVGVNLRVRMDNDQFTNFTAKEANVWQSETMAIPPSEKAERSLAFHLAEGDIKASWCELDNVTWMSAVPVMTYDVTYDKGTYGEGAGRTDKKTNDVDLVLADRLFTRDDYTQEGWSKNADSTTKDYNLKGSYTENAAITLYPYWLKKGKYTVSYLAGTGATGSAAAQTAHEGETVVLHGDGHFSRTGYSQDGWATSDLGEKAFDFDDPYDKNVSTNLYPCWTNNRYTVTFNPNGGSVTPAPKAVTFDKAYGDLPTPERTGFTFTGWTAPSAPSPTDVVTKDTVVKIAGNHELCATWALNVGQVSEALDCGNLVFEKSGGWEIVDDADFAYPAGNSRYLRTASIDAGDGLTVTIDRPGTLKFYCRGNGQGWEQTDLFVKVNDVIRTRAENLTEDAGWVEKSVTVVADDIPAAISFICGSNGDYCALDFVTWTPEGGGEPVPGDPVEVTAAGVVNGEFSLTIPTDPGADYGVWTNADLTIDSWGLMGEPQPGKGQPLEFKWTIIPGFPQLFFKAHKVEYK